jgi:hypothetical protein
MASASRKGMEAKVVGSRYKIAAAIFLLKTPAWLGSISAFVVSVPDYSPSVGGISQRVLRRRGGLFTTRPSVS